MYTRKNVLYQCESGLRGHQSYQEKDLSHEQKLENKPELSNNILFEIMNKRKGAACSG